MHAGRDIPSVPDGYRRVAARCISFPGVHHAHGQIGRLLPDDQAALCGLLDLLRISVIFERGHGDVLYYRQDGEEVAILDLVGGYGSLPFGHAEDAVRLAECRPR